MPKLSVSLFALALLVAVMACGPKAEAPAPEVVEPEAQVAEVV